jgi:hypothetical protein
VAYFNLSGKIPVHCITLQMFVSGDIMNGMFDLIILLDYDTCNLYFQF